MDKRMPAVILSVGLVIGLMLGWLVFSNSFAITGNAKDVINDRYQINANSCNADEVCETNKISTNELYSENGIIKITNSTYLNGPIGFLITNQNEFVNIVNLKNGVATGIFSAGTHNNFSQIYITSNIVGLGNRNDFENTLVQLGDLNGEGEAYACLSSEGVIYRSNFPCR